MLRVPRSRSPRADSEAAGAEQLEELICQLRSELLELDVEAVQRASAGTPPPGARAVDVLALGRLLVTVARPLVDLPAIVQVILAWSSGRSQRHVRLEIQGDVLDVTGLSPGVQRILIDSWIQRHARQPKPR